MPSSPAGDTIDDDLIQWLLINDDVAGRITHSDAGDFLQPEVLASTDPVSALLQNAHRNVTARHIGFPVPTHTASFNDPGETIGFLFNVDSKHAKKIRDLAEDYQDVKKQRVALLAEEVKLKTELIAFVLKSEAPVDPKDAHREIRAGDVVVRITPDEKMKVKIKATVEIDLELIPLSSITEIQEDISTVSKGTLTNPIHTL